MYGPLFALSEPDPGQLIVEPTSEPISLEDAKVFLHAGNVSVDEDAEIQSCIRAARRQVEEDCRLALIEQTRRMVWGYFPHYSTITGRRTFFLKPGPVISVESLKYLDADGNQQTLDDVEYMLDASWTHARLEPAAGSFWPGAATPAQVIVEFKAGFGPTAASLPEPLIRLVKLATRQHYETRTPSGMQIGSGNEFERGTGNPFEPRLYGDLVAHWKRY